MIAMGLGWLALTVALLGGAKLLYQYFFTEYKLTSASLIAQLVTLGLAFTVGWILSAISIRRLQNLILPKVIQIYSFCIVAGMLSVYGRAMYKIYKESGLTYSKYFIVLIIGYLLLVGLHLLVSDHDLLPHSIILLIAAFLHLLLAVYHYVFAITEKPDYVFADLFFLLVILGIAILLQQRWFYRPFKNSIAAAFPPTY